MDSFQRLGIEPTKDIRAIKGAYAKMLKVYSPEKDPDGFQALRAAYEEAIKRAKEEAPLEAPLSPVDQFMKDVEDTYLNFEKRINVQHWEALLERDVCYNIDTGQEAMHKILSFLMDHYQLPHQIWKLLDDHFSWNSKRDKLFEGYPKNFIDFIIYKASNDDFFHYESLLSSSERADEFIEAYHYARRSLDEVDLYHAGKALKDAEEICPGHPDLQLLQARYVMECGKVEEACRLLTNQLEADPGNFFGYIMRGNLYVRIGSLTKAYEDYKEALTIQPDYTDLLISLGKCCTYLEKYEEALEYLSILRNKLPYRRDIWVLYHSANAFHLEYLIEQAVINQDDIELKGRLAEAYLDNNRLEEAYELLKSLDSQGLLNSRNYVLLLRVLLGLGKKELAYSKVMMGKKLFPHDYNIAFYYAYILDQLGRLEEAIQYYDQAIELNPKDEVSYNNKAYLLNKLNRHAEALEWINQAIALNPASAHAYKNKAETLLGLRLYQEAFEACEEARSKNPYLEEVYVIKMKLFIAVGQYDEALSTYRSAMEYDLRDSRLVNERANVLRLKGQYPEAIQLCNEALELDEKKS